MTDTRFTPGPWEKVHDHPNPETRVSLAYIRGPVDEYGMREEIASVYSCNYGDRQQGFNAHLIASAPELYEALQSMCWGFKELNNNIDCGEEYDAYLSALAALAKARGEL